MILSQSTRSFAASITSLICLSFILMIMQSCKSDVNKETTEEVVIAEESEPVVEVITQEMDFINKT